MLFGHLKMHGKYLFDVKTCQIVAAVGHGEMGHFVGDYLLGLLIHCSN
jgi:hypothetical protein